MSDPTPSYFDVDLDILEGRAPDTPLPPELDAHRTHLRELSEPLPDWLPRARPSPTRRWIPLLIPALLATVVWLIPVLDPSPPYVGPKSGAPTMTLHIANDHGSTPADSSVPIAPGERFRVEIAGFDDPAIALLFVEAPDRVTVLYRGPATGLLPGAWTLDDAPAPARLVVVGGPGVDSLSPQELLGDVSRARVEIRVR